MPMKPRRKRNRKADQWVVVSARLRRHEREGCDEIAKRYRLSRAAYIASLIRGDIRVALNVGLLEGK